MPNCNCSVNSCANNSQGCCCRPSIQVAGNSAMSSSGTACSSFMPIGSATNSAAQFNQPNPALKVACSASNCCHNGGKFCQANNISIYNSGSGSQCATFTEGVY